MADLAHSYGTDLSFDASGDVLISTGTQETQDRVLRRLLTAPGAYLWHLDYGAGIAAMLGQPIRAEIIRAVVQEQMAIEASVATTPAPSVTVQAQPTGQVTAGITYVDAPSGQPQTLSLPG